LDVFFAFLLVETQTPWYTVERVKIL